MIGNAGAPATAAAPSVHELQALAEKAARQAQPRRRRAMSRAAQLQLIDILSRWAGSGLAAIAGVSLFIAATVGRAYPLRAMAWGVILFAALYVCRRLQREFRAGAKSAARPFRWRSNYTASLSVLGAAFGAGAVIAVPAGAPPELALQTLALLLVAILVASVLHAAHGRSAAAICLPASAFVLLGAMRDVGVAPALAWATAVAATGVGSVFLFHRFLRQRAIRRFPRTGLVRREVESRQRRLDDAHPPAAARA